MAEYVLIPQNEMNIIYVDSEEMNAIQRPAINILDGNPNTFWHTEWSLLNPPHPHEVQIDLGRTYDVNGFRYLPRQDLGEGNENGMIKNFEFYVTDHLSYWGTPVATGTFLENKNEQEVIFSAKKGRYIRLVALSEFRIDGTNTSMAEINVLGISDPCKDIVCPNVCVGKDLYSQRCDPSTGKCITDQLIEQNSELCITPGVLIPQNEMNIIYVDSEEMNAIQRPAINILDGNPNTFWHTEWSLLNPPHPHEVQIDLGRTYDVNGFRYLPRQDLGEGNENGMIKNFEFYVTDHLSYWGTPVATGTFLENKNEQEVIFSAKKGRYIRLVALSEFRIDGTNTSMAEINVLGISDPCKDIVCPNVCVGKDLYSQICVDGYCVTDKLLESNSLSCEYTPSIIELTSFEFKNEANETITSAKADEVVHANLTVTNKGDSAKAWIYLGFSTSAGSTNVVLNVATILNKNESETYDTLKWTMINEDTNLSISLQHMEDQWISDVFTNKILSYTYAPCEGVDCPNVCVGNDLYSQRCHPSTGKCILDELLEKDSIVCKIPTDTSTIQKYLVLGGLGAIALVELLANRK